MLAASERSGSAGGGAPCGVVHGRPHPLDVDQRVGQHVLDGLEGADGLAELHAVLRVVHRHRRARDRPPPASRRWPGWRPGPAAARRRRRRPGAPPASPSKARTPSSTRAVHGGHAARAAPPRPGRPRRRRRPPRPRRHVRRRGEGGGRRLTAQAHPPARPGRATAIPPSDGCPGDAADGVTLAERLPPVPPSRPSARASARSAPRGPARGQERRGHQAAPDLLAQHRHLHHAEIPGRPRPRAPRWRSIPGRPWPTTRSASKPCGTSAASGRADEGSRLLARSREGPHHRPGPDPRPERVVAGHRIEQRGRRVAQRLLIRREVEVHGGAVYGPPLTPASSPIAAAVPCCGRWICAPRPSRSRCAAVPRLAAWSICRGPTASGCRRASTTSPRRSPSGGGGRPTWPPTAGSASPGPRSTAGAASAPSRTTS